MKCPILVLIWLLCLLPTLVVADKTDVIVLKNGDRITGEIKRLDAGLLEYSTDAMGSVFIEWRFVSEVISNTNNSVELQSGERVLGTLQKPENGDHVIVNTLQGPLDVKQEDVVSVWPVKATFKDRMDLDISLGFDYEKATEIAGLSTSLDFRTKTNDRTTEATLRMDITRQPGFSDQTRLDMNYQHQYMLGNKHFRTWLGKAESNDASNIDLRLSGGAAFGRYLIKTNNQWFSIAGGLLVTEEKPSNLDAQTNIETVGSFRYKYFNYAEPQRSFDSILNIYPSLTDSGRIRANFRTTFKLEFIKDLFWSMELWATHDNQPLSPGVEETDYGVTTSVGWSY
jgi:hypothetical protein